MDRKITLIMSDEEFENLPTFIDDYTNKHNHVSFTVEYPIKRKMEIYEEDIHWNGDKGRNQLSSH